MAALWNQNLSGLEYSGKNSEIGLEFRRERTSLVPMIQPRGRFAFGRVSEGCW